MSAKRFRVGIVGWLHESNTFSSQPTTYAQFRDQTLVRGDELRRHFVDSHHEIGGFLEALDGAGDEVQVTPIFAARALPSGAIDAESYDRILNELLQSVEEAGPLDGVLAAPHGATVSERQPDADGFWLSALRRQLGPSTPLIATLDAHANLSAEMVRPCNAIVAYRSNPHLDQRQRGVEAGEMMLSTLRGSVRPTMAALLPPMAINIEKQCTEEPHWEPMLQMAGEQRNNDVLSNSILLGFPYSDVHEMGSAVIAVTNDDYDLAAQRARELAAEMWARREDFVGEFLDVPAAFERSLNLAESGPVCLLDMGDNVGGGSSADGTFVLEYMRNHSVGGCFVCLADPEAVAHCESAGCGAEVTLPVGGKTDESHGATIEIQGRVVSMHDGRFRESKPRHGGITEFDQGRTAVVETNFGSAIMLTTKRMTPFSLEQLRSCDVDPARFRILVAKGVNAPIAAYREVCSSVVRVNTEGSTCADMRRLDYKHRRRPLFPLETDLEFDVQTADVSWGHPGNE